MYFLVCGTFKYDHISNPLHHLNDLILLHAAVMKGKACSVFWIVGTSSSYLCKECNSVKVFKDSTTLQHYKVTSAMSVFK